MSIIEAIILGVIEGVTEFLPISSTGHLTIAEQALGFNIDDADITAFTAIIQIGAVAAVLIFFWGEIRGMLAALWRGLRDPTARTAPEYRYGLAVVIGSIPIAIVAVIFRHHIEDSLRSLWVVGSALILWSIVMYMADQSPTQRRHESDFNNRDGLAMGLMQCIALIPGVSRSGATIAAGLFRGLDRVTVTRLSFFLAIPALTAAGIFEAISKSSEISAGVGWGPTLVAIAVSFIVAYASVAWLLRYVAGHNFAIFILYRVALGVVILGLLATGTVSAT